MFYILVLTFNHCLLFITIFYFYFVFNFNHCLLEVVVKRQLEILNISVYLKL